MVIAGQRVGTAEAELADIAERHLVFRAGLQHSYFISAANGTPDR
jgi:hypothetical protein